MGKTAAIIGSGIAGPAMALALKRIGWSPVLYEAGAGLKDSGAGISLAPNGLRMLDQFISKNAYHHLLREGADIKDGLGFYYSDGKAINDKPMKFKETFGYPLIGLRRHVLRKVLLEEVARERIPISFNSRLVALQSGANDVSFSFADGSDSSADLLLGCDGIHLATRSILFGDQKPTFTGTVAYLGLSEDVDSPIFNHKSTILFGADGVLGSYALGGGKRTWFSKDTQSTFEPEEWSSRRDTEEIKSKIKQRTQGWVSPVSELIDSTYRALRLGVFDRPPLQAWHHGRVALVGDACHPMAPTLGQGANTSLEDVAVLTSLLSDLRPGDHPDAVFRLYQEERLERTSKMAQSSRYAGDWVYVRNPIARKIRDPLLRLGFNSLYKRLFKPIYGYTFQV